VKKMQSAKKSWAGFKLSKNILSALKKCIYVLVPAILAELVAHNIIVNGLAAVIGSAALNAIEFYFKQIEVKD